MNTVVIGLGNEFRGDDAAGRKVARSLLDSTLPPHVEVREATGESARLLELWDGKERVLLVDAVHSGAEPGTIHRFDASSSPLPGTFSPTCSTHSLSLPDAIGLARTLGRLPRVVIVYGIEGRNFETGAPPTPATSHAADRARVHFRSPL